VAQFYVCQCRQLRCLGGELWLCRILGGRRVPTFAGSNGSPSCAHCRDNPYCRRTLRRREAQLITESRACDTRAARTALAAAIANVRFSIRPVGVKRFQTIHHNSIDVARGDGDGWTGSAGTDAQGLWQAGYRTNDCPAKGQNAFWLACRGTRLRNYPSGVKSPLSGCSRICQLSRALLRPHFRFRQVSSLIVCKTMLCLNVHMCQNCRRPNWFVHPPTEAMLIADCAIAALMSSAGSINQSTRIMEIAARSGALLC
jgi:hypothetical protein